MKPSNEKRVKSFKDVPSFIPQKTGLLLTT